jgi:hypothetical protein
MRPLRTAQVQISMVTLRSLALAEAFEFVFANERDDLFA